MNGTVRNGETSRKSFHFIKSDAAALAVFFVLAGFMLFFSRRQWLSLDEASYFVMPQRFLMGDRFFVDDWTFAQLTAIFHLVPYGVFRAVTGGSDGVVYFMKLLAIAVNLILYWYCYAKLRKKSPLAGIAAAFFLCADPNLGYWTLSYYAMTTHALTILAATLFLAEGELPPYRLLFAGVLLSCAVVMVPTLAALYLLFCVLAAAFELRKKKKKASRLQALPVVVNRRSWIWLTAGVVCCAALLLGFLLVNAGGIRPLAEGIAAILGSDDMSEHSFSLESVFSVLYCDVTWPIAAFGVVNVAAAVVLVAAAAVIAWKMRRRKSVSAAVRGAVFAAAVAVCLTSVLTAAKGLLQTNVFPEPELRLPLFADNAYNYMYFCILSSTAPTYFLCTVSFLLNREKERRMTAFFAFTVLCSVLVDPVSNGSFLFGGRCAYLPAAYFTAGTLRELLADRGAAETARPRRGAAVAAGVLICTLLLGKAGFLTAQSLVNVPVKTTNLQTIETGPYKRMLADPQSVARYDLLHADLDYIRENDGGPVYIAAWFPYCYVYLDLPRGAHTAKFYSDEFDESANQTALVRYWREKPEKRPEYIYVPKINENGFPDREQESRGRRYTEFLATVCRFETIAGKAGDILKVTDWLL
ncbi:MAG: hypothetical protein IJL26_13815 [Clostridia bacterium]|nr:hypothetical protein [Clostridia bacterium]